MNKLRTKLLAGALALTVIVPSASIAATDAGESANQGYNHKGMFHHAFKKMGMERHKAHQEQIMELVKKYSPELEDQFQSTFDKMEERKKQHQPQLDDATKEKLAEIRKQVKEGTLTKEQAKDEMAKLGIEFRHKDGKHKDRKHFGHKDGNQKDNIHNQLMQAVEANDEAKIKELLAQLLTKMQDRLQQDTE